MLTLFFVDQLPTAVGSTFEFNNDDAMHAIRVLRTTIGDVFNIGGIGEVTIKQLAEQVLAVTGSKSEITYTPYSDAYPAGFEDIQRRVPDIAKVEGAIGWSPTRDLQQIISDIAAH